MKALYKRLAALGYKERFVKDRILPPWWQDQMAANPGSMAQAQLIVSRELQLDIDTVLGDGPIARRDSVTTHFKTRSDAPPAECEAVAALATRLAVLAARSCVVPYDLTRFASASGVRSAILQQGAGAVDFRWLLEYCWGGGVPVVHMTQAPEGCKKPVGLITLSDGRPVIIVTSVRRDPSWHLFYIAHELGHLLSRHLEESLVLFDEKVEFEPQQEIEQQANSQALEILTGVSDFMLDSIRFKDAAHLAALATTRGVSWKVDPGFLVLNFSHHNSKYIPASVKALEHLHPNEDSAGEQYARLYTYLDLDEIPSESRRVFSALTTME